MDTSALSGLSTQCQGALPRLLTSSFATCADVLGLVQLASASGSIVPALDSYIGDLCTTTPCTSSDLSNADSIIEQGCSSDIQSGSLIPTALQLIIQNFDGIRTLLCTQQTSNSSYCIPEILYAAQNATGTEFNLTTLSSIAGDQSAGANLLSAVPSSVYCTDCGEAITIEAIQIIQKSNASSEEAVNTVRQSAQQQCGAGFANGTTLPAGITTSSSSNSSSVSSNSKNNNTGAAIAGFSTKQAVVFGTLAATLASALVAVV
ncbi:hypothetical protein P389DRAFT_20210 [Cystobasidium minutum MCA 4210]|uniref:uncharacterized protein n=1 Tax=Cystobasidium minutum MCA 4210 TaxID=1397322 RepID=UPI0034CFF3E9|eukprot:jgi/Rhomi1/20210/CE20209_21654